MAVKLETIALPTLPEGWTAEKSFKPLGKLSHATQRAIAPVGAHFLAEARRKRHKRTFSEDERIQASEKAKKTEDDDAGEISEPENPMMLQREAKDWKEQDHYAVLGITKYRYKATDDQIKKAHRKKVLKHHPDKRAAVGSTEDDRFFKCIQKATELLLDPVRRRQFDSVDEEANVDAPSKKETKQGNFFKLWRPVFESESRFSKQQPVPQLGSDKSAKEDVDHFYNYWYKDFDSWRSFEYQDEDVPDDSADRDQKRHIEKKNLNARRKKKTEDTKRLRTLVDTALDLDPRIAKFKEAEKKQRNKKKDEREAQAKKDAEEAAKKKEEDERLAKEKEVAGKAEKADSKKAKEAAKTAVKKNKRVVRNAPKDANYFHGAGDAPPDRINNVLNDVDLVLAKVDPDELAELTSKLSIEKDAGKIQAVLGEEVKRLVGAGKLKDGDAKSLCP
ncbi:MAG: hypothetical protein M1828_007239 [Chrysothrix sp. TS-e1954]|nr:MAG: hypothetical protein M1828_007239 [Chrysothrix sp. TS-e1954]